MNYEIAFWVLACFWASAIAGNVAVQVVAALAARKSGDVEGILRDEIAELDSEAEELREQNKRLTEQLDCLGKSYRVQLGSRRSE